MNMGFWLEKAEAALGPRAASGAGPRLMPSAHRTGRERALQRSIAPGGDAMAREFSVIIERDADGCFVASVPALRGCHTQATSLDELMARVREAVELCLEVQGENVELLDFIGVQKITVA
jgi:predicted RNase H-like HicB family nuclease